ncbi:MAG: hypothetical protein OEZ00_03720 [Dehalococcoidia bacterium]|nr:hypothetical protein [Dehalococcoidia bacterium]
MVRVTKSAVAKRLADVPQEKRFWCQDGRALKSLSDLEIALRDMSDGVFHHHVSETNNDFSNWVRDVVGDMKLSSDLRKSRTQLQVAKSIADRIAWLKSKIATG